MKRKIKFRGRCVNSGEFVYGDLIHGVGHKSGNLYILPNKLNLAYVKHCDPLDGVKIDSDTVGEFTGLHDKNGKEIYEGDVLSGWRKGSNSDRNYQGVIQWRIDQCGFVLMCGKYVMEILSLAMSGDADKTMLDSFEVIGNIYENPEFLQP